jgi:5'(3')-deoxyribonucleotidase
MRIRPPQLFLDCDGVLADFDRGAETVFGCHPRKYENEHGTEKFWATLHAHPKFYENLPVMEDASALYEATRHLNPIIITGCPQGGWAQEQKLRWRNKNFPGVPMITTLSKNKRDHAKPGDILIDDYLKYKHLWEEMGGVFIHHNSALESLIMLSRVVSL